MHEANKKSGRFHFLQGYLFLFFLTPGCLNIFSNGSLPRFKDELPIQELPRTAPVSASSPLGPGVALDSQGIPIPVRRSFEMKLSPEPKPMLTQTALTFNVVSSQARPPFHFTRVSGPGTITSSGLFISQQYPGITVIRVIDSVGTFNEFSMSVEPRVRVVERVSINDTLFSDQWALNSSAKGNIAAQEAWTIHSDCSSVLVAVVDYGIYREHRDLAESIWRNPNERIGSPVDNDGNSFVGDEYGWNFVQNNNQTIPNLVLAASGPPASPQPQTTDFEHFSSDDHGTHVAGIIGASGNNSVGVSGVCLKASILPVTVFESGQPRLVSNVARGIRYAVNMNAKIINASIGGYESTIPDSNILREAVEYAERHEVLLVVSVGNNRRNIDVDRFIPSSYKLSNIISVAATTITNHFADNFSDFGPNTVHIAAPGLDILSTSYLLYSNNTHSEYYRWKSGNSMSTPMVTGAAALLWSYRPSLSMQQVKDHILRGSDIISDLSGRVEQGRKLNLFKILNEAR